MGARGVVLAIVLLFLAAVPAAAATGEAAAPDLGAAATVEADAMIRLAMLESAHLGDRPVGQSGSTADGRTLPSGPAAGSGGVGPVFRVSRNVEAAAAPIRRGGGSPGPSWLSAIVPRERDLGLFLAAQASLFIDMAQTMEVRRAGGLVETNTLLGARPRDEVVVTYFGSVAVLHALAYAVLPGSWSNLVSRGILFVEVPAIDNNARLGIRVQF